MNARERIEMEEKSLGQVVKDLTEDLSTLVRSEIALAKLEIKQTAAGIGIASALFAGALFCTLAAVAFLLVTAVLALAEVIAPWLSALILALVLLGAAVVLGFLGKKKIARVQFVPTETVESVKSNVQAIKTDLRVRKEAS